jgi:hypothetical protein
MKDTEYAKPGDVVEYGSCWSGKGRKDCEMDCCTMVAIVLDIYDDVEVPPAYRLMWSDGSIKKEWSDEIGLVQTCG